MLLCDIGNTSYHFLSENKNYKESVQTFDPQTLQDKVYFICVNATISQLLQDLENWIDLSSYIDKSSYYETMGIDRIVALKTVTNAVVVDAGSAITVDVVKDGVFEGGYIYPGINAMQECYKNISPALSYEFDLQVDLNRLAKNSQDAVSYGFLKGLYLEVLSHKLPIILTGGDGELFQPLFETAVFDETLIFKGMKQLVHQNNSATLRKN